MCSTAAAQSSRRIDKTNRFEDRSGMFPSLILIAIGGRSVSPRRSSLPGFVLQVWFEKNTSKGYEPDSANDHSRSALDPPADYQTLPVRKFAWRASRPSRA